MESKKVILQTIRRLKEIKEQYALTIPLIMKKMSEKGYYVSEPTLKRIFAQNSEAMNFRYQESIVPVAEVLFAEYGDTDSTDDAETLRQIIRERDKSIENLMIKIENLEKATAQMEKMYAERKSMFENTIAQMKEEIAILKDQIEKKDEMLSKMMDAFIKI